jgi:hypothetical protein
MDRDAEVAEIKRELEILRARHALYAKWGRVLKAFFMVWAPLFVLCYLAVAVTVSQFDAVYGAFFATMTLVITGSMYWLLRTPPGYRDRRFGWIDLASPPIRFANRYTDIRSYLLRWGPSEEQIAAREQRLMELGVPS